MEPLRLPSTIVSRVDVARLMRELTGLNDFFVGSQARTAGTAMQLPRLSRLIDQVARENNINLLDANHRKLLLENLQAVYDRAPSFHVSFATEPSPKATEKLLVWMRQNIHPQILLSIGLQPSIAAGCVLRTTNKVFDLSLRAKLKQETGYLSTLIKGAVDGR
jgi:F0F1-type ATP synthase delta subunit